MTIFTEVRLATSAACRAWTADQGCFSAVEWESELGRLPTLRFVFERARLRISEALAVEGVDKLGIARQLLVHESSSPLTRAEIRGVGFVHLENASGIHLYALWRAYEFGLARIASRLGLGLRATEFLRTVPPLGIGFAVFALAGCRPGLLRPLLLVGARWAARRFGIRWARWAPIVLALAFDALCGLLFSFGTEHTFAEWAPGELHYAAAWWGGILGYEWARSRRWGTFRSHAALSVAAWAAVLPLDLADRRFAPATPLLSLLTVEVLVRGGFVGFFSLAVLTAFGVALGKTALEWTSFFFNRGVAIATTALATRGWMREIPDEYSGPTAALAVLAVGFLCVASYPSHKKGI